MEEKSLSIAFSDSLKEESVACISDLVEVGLDAILDDGILKDIPILSTAVAVYKIGSSIKERYNVKKLIVFLNEINNGIADEQKRTEYQQKFKNNEKFRNQELEYLLILIDRYTSYDKPQMLAKLFLAYLDEIILWEEFAMYAEVIDRFLLMDCNTLVSDSKQIIVHRNIGGESVLRLVALGLMTEQVKTDTSAFFTNDNDKKDMIGQAFSRAKALDKIYVRTEFGDRLADILK